LLYPDDGVEGQLRERKQEHAGTKVQVPVLLEISSPVVEKVLRYGHAGTPIQPPQQTTRHHHAPLAIRLPGPPRPALCKRRKLLVLEKEDSVLHAGGDISFWCPVPVQVRTTVVNKHTVKHTGKKTLSTRGSDPVRKHTGAPQRVGVLLMRDTRVAVVATLRIETLNP